jgi:HAD superfamily hydrolase (TIGR01509 family)
MIEAVIFDMDGVLADTEPFHKQVEQLVFAEAGLQIEEKEHWDYSGVATDVMWQMIAQHHQLPRTIEEMVIRNSEVCFDFFSNLEHIEPMPGLVNILQKIKDKGYKMGVGTSSVPEIIEIVLNRCGIRQYFEAIANSGEAGKSKPAPDVFLLAAQKLGVDPQNCIVVEDSKNGIAAAKAANMYCVAYCPASSNQDVSKADTVISHYNELACILNI